MTSPHTRLAPDVYLTHLREESARFRAVLTDCDPAAGVPSCPGWSAADLLWHLATVQRWWAEVLTARPERPEDVDPPRPAAYDDLLGAFDEWSARLVEVLDGADPGEEEWCWSDDHTVGFILRRQAHEALVHRVDAELTAGTPSEVDAVLAADGVHEVLDVMYGGCPPWGSWEPGEGLVRVDATDTGAQFWMRFGTFSGTSPESGTTYGGEEDFHVVPAPGEDASRTSWSTGRRQHWTCGCGAAGVTRRSPWPATGRPTSGSGRSWTRRSTDAGRPLGPESPGDSGPRRRVARRISSAGPRRSARRRVPRQRRARRQTHPP